MTELDFDELDKAVNDLMSDTGEPAPAADTVVSAPAPVAAVPTPAAAPVAATSDTAATPPSTAPATPPLAVKRRGRFMDVMGPAPQPAASPAPTVQREGVAIASPSPDEPALAPAPEPPVTAEPAPVAMPELPEASTAPDKVEEISTETVEVTNAAATPAGDYASDPAPAHEWPDPVELDQKPADSTEEPSVQSEASDTAASGQSSDDFTMPDPIDVAAGQASGENDKPDDALATVVMPDEAPTTAVTDAPAEPTDTSTPAEGADEPMAVSPFLPDAKVEKRPLGNQLDTPGSATDTPALPRELSGDVMGLEADDKKSSITTADTKQAEGAVLGAEAYHQPLEAPAKSKNGWMAVVWILIVLIVGAMAGAAYFYFTTQR